MEDKRICYTSGLIAAFLFFFILIVVIFLKESIYGENCSLKLQLDMYELYL
jgi:hypothetical protein